MSGSHRSGGHDREYGPYHGRDHRGHGGYEAGSGGYRLGGYQAGSGAHRAATGHRTGTGTHRVVREPHTGRRVAITLAGVGVGAVACVLAAVAILGGSDGHGNASGQVVGSSAAESTPMDRTERSLVPDTCTTVGDDLAARLAPGATRNQADNYQGNDRQNQCVWGAYTGDRKRQLTVELRAIPGNGDRTATDAAGAAFASERKDDESGKALLAGQELTEKRGLDDVGDEGYAVYSVDGAQGSGEAIANVRAANVLVTVHYSGSDKGDPLAAKTAINGAVQAAKAVLQNLD
ncbi:hypothetical protein AGRA3207_004930 [Actinomadura graeca]|uniref:DUF3558 domain-containing protein n=1 Tax=Actinomadura graeca TaxID=2750812 RepID=A0ABX8QY88_9ACTN|nr:hypothetical protein [Actinomadura graeca]QXJ23735.1 hypothetical protein AGRA3207_004930 [Actinomadura graeca]